MSFIYAQSLLRLRCRAAERRLWSMLIQPAARKPQLCFDLQRRPGGGMQRLRRAQLALLIVLVAVRSAGAQNQATTKAVVWIAPGNIHTKNLYWGPGGEEGRPKLPVEFEKEDIHGTSPKFDVHDAEGKKWGAKMGLEPRPE